MDFIKIKHFCSLKNAIILKEWKRMKSKAKDCEKTNCKSSQLQRKPIANIWKRICIQIYKEFSKLKSKKTAQWKAGQKISKDTPLRRYNDGK